MNKEKKTVQTNRYFGYKMSDVYMIEKETNISKVPVLLDTLSDV